MANIKDTPVLALQQRGAGSIVRSDKKRLFVEIDQTRCMGAESCVAVAPQAFALDLKQLGLFRKGNQPLGLKNVKEGAVDKKTIVITAKSCPHRAIYLEDVENGEVLAGDPQ